MEMMERNRKLRLLVTTDCPNHCPMCCNNQFNFDNLERVKDFDYDEIIITGGEPLLFYDAVINLIDAIKISNSILYPEEKVPKFYIYTSITKVTPVLAVLPYVDGIVVTPHNKSDVASFEYLNKVVKIFNEYHSNEISFRLNLFKNIKDMLPKDIDLSLWHVKDMEWIKDCPVPKGEDFRRLPQLWHNV